MHDERLISLDRVTFVNWRIQTKVSKLIQIYQFLPIVSSSLQTCNPQEPRPATRHTIISHLLWWFLGDRTHSQWQSQILPTTMCAYIPCQLCIRRAWAIWVPSSQQHTSCYRNRTCNLHSKTAFQTDLSISTNRSLVRISSNPYRGCSRSGWESWCGCLCIFSMFFLLLHQLLQGEGW